MLVARGRLQIARSPLFELRRLCARWQVALELLDMGFDVLLLDPDLALLRNPLPYFETLPACDMLVSIDAAADPTGAHSVQTGGCTIPGGVEGTNFYNFFNTGVIMFRASLRVRAWVRAFVAHVTAEYERGSTFEDQFLFNRFLQSAHTFRFNETGHASPGQYVFDAVMSNRCLRCVAVWVGGAGAAKLPGAAVQHAVSCKAFEAGPASSTSGAAVLAIAPPLTP